jgi:hypothetical protein
MKDLTRATRRKIKLLKKKIQDEKVMKKLGVLAMEMIRKRTQTGWGVNNDEAEKPNRHRLEDLSPSYVRQLKKMPESELGPFATRTKKCNLTRTGQMLKAMKAKGHDGGFEIKIKGPRKNESVTNEEVARFASEGSSNRPKRPFFALTDKEQKILHRKYQLIIRTLSRQILT